MKSFSKKMPLFVFSVLVITFCFAQPVQANDGRSLYVITQEAPISAIAAETGTDTELLAAMNNLSPQSTLKSGQSIWLPEEPEDIINVAAGDTLWDLAQKYHTTVEVLISKNEIKNARALSIGQSLRIPVNDIIEEPGTIVASNKKNQELETASRGGSYCWPLKGIITSKYGYRSSGFHHGLDIAAATGTGIAAIMSGEVIQAGWLSGIYGYTVTINHGGNVESLYAHLNAILVKEGQIVNGGQIIAKVGETGNATGPHLHLQISIDDKTIDPLKVLR